MVFVAAEVDLRADGTAVLAYTVQWQVISGELHGFYFLVIGKQRSMIAAHHGLEDVRWERLDWTPPKLILSNFRVPGKVCTDLTPLEAAFYMEIPFKRILSAMLESMVSEGYLKVIYTTPVLRVRVLSTPDLTQLDPYERMFFESIEDDGMLSQAELEALMNLAVENIQKKAWDCDVEATQQHYRGVIGDFEKGKREEAARERGLAPREYDDWYWWYVDDHLYFRHHYIYDRDPWHYEDSIPVNTDHLVKGLVDTSLSLDLTMYATMPVTRHAIARATGPVTAHV